MKIKINDNVNIDELNDNIMITFYKDGTLDLNTALVLDGVSYDIFRLIMQGKDELDIINALCLSYVADRATIERDVKGFIGELVERGVAHVE